MLRARDEAAKERCMEAYGEEKRKDGGVYIYHSKKEVASESSAEVAAQCQLMKVD